MDVTQWSDAEIEKHIADVYDGSVSPAKLPVDLYKEIHKRLMTGVIDGFSFGIDDALTFSTGSRELDLLEHFNHNVAIFSGAKTHQQVVDMTREVFKDGTKQSFADFKESAGKIFDTYNKDWLLTEFKMSHNQALSGRRWLDITRNADVFPALKYVTTGDQRVRDEHVILDGIVRPVNDLFWRRFYPPNDWGCRCGVEQMTERELSLEKTPDAKIEQVKQEYTPSKLFDGNAGIDKIIWQPEHPYFLVSDRYKLLKENNFNLPVPPLPKKVKIVPETPATTVVKPENEKIAKIHASMKSITGLTPEFVNPRIWNSVYEKLEFKGGKDIPKVKRDNDEHWFHSPTEKKIYLNTRPDRWRNGERWRPMVTTHEIGHNVHTELKEITNDLMSERATKFIGDLKSSFEKTFPTYSDKAFFEYSFAPTSGLKRVREFIREQGVNDHGFQGEVFSTMTDVVGGLTTGDHGGGHTVKYYRYHNGRQGFKEVFANLFQITQQTDPIHRAVWEKFFPDALKIADDYFNDILK